MTKTPALPSGLPGAFQTHTPTELAHLAQNLWKAQQMLKNAMLKLKPLEETIDSLERELQHALVTANIESIASKNATVSLRRTEFAEIEDDRAFFAFATKKANWDLIRKQCNVGAAKARWEDGIKVPGVKKAVRVALTVTTR